ncbi:MAG: hypothetical protein BWY75_01470 [bacterium ADurb.Bin425]|nr:MAG: hypothetical protein BWY75_01470 [bacterium ADurb.Bin425]
MQDAFKEIGATMGSFPISERLSREVLSLPMYPELTDEQVVYVAASIKEHMKKAGSGQTADCSMAVPQAIGSTK